jgi:hypothetical protein
LTLLRTGAPAYASSSLRVPAELEDLRPVVFVDLAGAVLGEVRREDVLQFALDALAERFRLGAKLEVHADPPFERVVTLTAAGVRLDATAAL